MAETTRDRTPLEMIKRAVQMWKDQNVLSADDYERKYYPEAGPMTPMIIIEAAIRRLEAAGTPTQPPKDALLKELIEEYHLDGNEPDTKCHICQIYLGLAASPSHAPTAHGHDFSGEGDLQNCCIKCGISIANWSSTHRPCDEARASAPPTSAPLNKSEELMVRNGWTFGESAPPTCPTCGSTDRSARRSGCRAAQENMWHSQPSAEGAKEGK